MATPVSVGATIIAVPSGPPPPPPPTMKPAGSPTAAASQPSQQAASFQPAPPHMLHWDCHHPGGQMLPLRQPVPPVYYNTSSGKESAGWRGPTVLVAGSGSISESSSTSGDQEGPQLYLQPEYHPVYGHLDMTRELRVAFIEIALFWLWLVKWHNRMSPQFYWKPLLTPAAFLPQTFHISLTVCLSEKSAMSLPIQTYCYSESE